jgi:hypothetical protein
MRTLNLSLISAVGAFALLLTAVALPTLDDRPLASWALVVGVFSSASVVSILYFVAALIPSTLHRRSHSVILATYFPALIIGAITGGFWGIVGHLMEAEKLAFGAAFEPAMPIIYGGYSLAALILFCAVLYAMKHRRHEASSV